LNLGPATIIIDRDQLHVGKALEQVGIGDVSRLRWSVKILRSQSLPLAAVEIFQIRGGQRSGSLAIYDFIDDRDGRLGQDGNRGNDDIEAVRAYFLNG